MRIISLISALISFILSIWLWNLNQDSRFLERQTKRTAQEISAVKQELAGLSKYKSQTALLLEKFYPDVFSTVRQVCLYYGLPYEIKVSGAKDFVNTQEFFKESKYKGIKYLDVLCQVDFKGQVDPYLFDMLCKMLKRKPLEILEAGIENNTLHLTMRLYGP